MGKMFSRPALTQEPRMKIKFCLLTPLLGIALSLPSYGQESSQPPAEVAGQGILQQYDQAIDDVAEKAMRSVVEIEVTGFGKPEEDEDSSDQQQVLERQRALGTGVIVDPDGYIVTNNHVVTGALRIHVILKAATVELAVGNTRLANPQRGYQAKLIGT